MDGQTFKIKIKMYQFNVLPKLFYILNQLNWLKHFYYRQRVHMGSLCKTTAFSVTLKVELRREKKKIMGIQIIGLNTITRPSCLVQLFPLKRKSANNPSQLIQKGSLRVGPECRARTICVDTRVPALCNFNLKKDKILLRSYSPTCSHLSPSCCNLPSTVRA